MAKETLFFVAQPGPSVETALPDGLRIVVFRPRPWRLNDHERRPSLTHAYWLLATLGRYEIWYVRDATGRIVHYSYVLPWIPTFPFMGRRDLEIGPCVTGDAHRGRGIYPAVLRAIRARRADAARLWVMTEATNMPSIRGIEKAGFRLAGHGRKRLHFFLLEHAASKG
jgi:RimJ/RimL family protein N-acetyltransferase